MVQYKGMRFFLPLALTSLATAVSVPLVMGYWGQFHPAFDSLSHFRMHLAILLVVLALPLLFFRGWRRMGAMAAVLGLASAGSILPYFPGAGGALAGAKFETADAPPARYRLLHLNLRYDNPTPKKVLSLIGRSNADVVTLNEVSAMWVGELERLKTAYPYYIICPPPARIGGVAILSRRPFETPSAKGCYDRGSMAVTSINFSGSVVDIATLHLGWPWPFEQHHQIGWASPALAGIGTTAILAGDLNATPWSLTARRVSAVADLTILKGIGPTWFKRIAPDPIRRLIGLPIDNMFVKGRIVPLSVERLEEVGSDHLPVLLNFSIRPEEQPAEILQVAL